MSSYTIEKIAGKREFDSKHGPLVSYKVEITGDDGFSGIAEITQKPATPPPSGTIEGTLDKSNPQFPPKLKKAPGGGGGFKGGGRPKPDEAEIRKAVAYKGAVEIVAALITHGTDRDPEADIERFFHHGLGLLEGKPSIKATPDPGSRATITRRDVTPAWQQYLKRMSEAGVNQQNARQKAELQKTALGIESLETATHDQLAALIEFFKGEA